MFKDSLIIVGLTSLSTNICICQIDREKQGILVQQVSALKTTRALASINYQLSHFM